MTIRNHIRRPHAATQSLTFRQVAAAYNFPLSKASGKGCTIGIVELGGGASASAITAALAEQHITPTGTLRFVGVGSGTNKPDGPDGADGEVQSDILGVLQVAPSANVVVVFGGNTDDDFYLALQWAFTNCDVVTLSWGGPESSWDATTLDKFAALIAAAAAKGVPLFVASGDSGADDGTRTPSVDFPASAPASIACGGTRLTLTSGGARLNEVTWDDSDTSSASGGGVSKAFPGRDVPDIAGNADPDTGYQVTIDGEDAVIGGTSLVAPLYAGLYALLLELNGLVSFDFRALVIAHPSVCFDVTSGDNGAFRAGPGRDETTGFGVVDGTKLLAVLQAASPPVTTPTQPTAPTSDPLSTFPVASFSKLVAAKHNYSSAETTAVQQSPEAWCEAVGINLAS